MEERKFYKLDAELTARKDLTPTDKLVYAVLLNYQGKNDYCWPSVKRLGGDTGLSHVTVIKSLKNLAKFGLVTPYKNGQGKVNSYTIEPVKNLYQLRGFSSKESLVEPVKNLYSDQCESFTTTSKESLPEPVKNLYTKRLSDKTHHKKSEKKRENNSSLSRLESHLGRKLNEYERNDLAHYEKQNGSDWCVEAVQMHPDVRWVGEAFQRCQPYDDPPAPVRTLVEHFGHVSRERRVKMIEEFRNHSEDRAQAVAHRTTEEWAERWGEYLQAILPWFGGIELGDLEAVS